jgi:two-component system, NarL family, response regulator LiaR
VEPIKLLLADDHRIFRQGLRELIEHKTDFLVVGEAATGREVLEQVEAARPDIVLLDIQMPEMDGVEVIQRLAEAYPGVKVIMLTMYQQDRQLFETIKAGARAYLLKDTDAEELMSVIRRVHSGDAALDPALTARVFDEFRRLGNSVPGSQAALTDREREILQLLAEGIDNRAIAARLFLSEKTVGNRLSEIFEKLGVTNRTQAAMVAVQRGLIPEPDHRQ